MKPFTEEELCACHAETLVKLERRLEQAALETNADERLRNAVLALLQFTFGQKTTEAFNRAVVHG